MQVIVQDVIVAASYYGAWRIVELKDPFPHNNIDEP
jgi:hypothetical protein